MTTQEIARPRSHKDAVEQLSETPYLVYVLVQCAKLFLSLIAKRWPDLV